MDKVKQIYPQQLSLVCACVCLCVSGMGYNDNKANLRDFIAATSLVILLKLDSNSPFFSLCDLEI